MNEKHKNDDYIDALDDTPDGPPVWTWTRLLLTIGGSIAYGILMFVIFRNRYYPASNDETGPAMMAFLVVVPVAIGALSCFAIPPERRTIGMVIWVALVTGGLFLLMAAMIYSGIWICVLMISPFVLVPIVIGALIMRFATRRSEKSKRQYAFVGLVLVLPYLLAPVEARYHAPDWFRTVQDEIVIRGTPNDVWQHIIRMEFISSDEQPPSFYQSAGIPRPRRAVLDFEGLGGTRYGQFEYGLTFREKIIVWEENSNVRFSVEVQHNPRSTQPLLQIGGRYFDILEAGYAIEPRDDGTLVLRLDSKYRLSTSFNFYAAFWSDWIMHDFQMYVLRTVKARIETEPSGW